MDVLWALGLGAVVGIVFGVARLLPPAPATLAGVAGIVGVWLGWVAASHFIEGL